MRTPPPLRGVQIPYMPAKTNSKVIPSVLCTAYFEDTRFVQGAIHTPWGGAGRGEWQGVGSSLSFSQMFTIMHSFLLISQNPTSPQAFSEKMLLAQERKGCKDRPQLIASSFPPCYHSLPSPDELELQMRAEQNWKHMNSHIQPKELGA